MKVTNWTSEPKDPQPPVLWFQEYITTPSTFLRVGGIKLMLAKQVLYPPSLPQLCSGLFRKVGGSNMQR